MVVNDEENGIVCTLEAFTHNEEVVQFIESLPSTYKDEKAMEITLEKLTVILNKYQEQPHLLDPYLDDHLQRLVNIVRNPNHEVTLKAKAFKFIRLIINVRGYKVVVRHLPHEVSYNRCFVAVFLRGCRYLAVKVYQRPTLGLELDGLGVNDVR